MFDYELSDGAKRAVPILGAVLYVVSLFLPTGAGLGILCLLLGWFEVVANPLDGIAWIANPLLLATWLLISARRAMAARVLGVVTLILGASWIFHHRAITSEAGGTEMVPLRVGYWVWLMSLMLAVLCAFFGVRGRDET